MNIFALDYYGLPVCYRFEDRAVGKTLIMSFRPGTGGVYWDIGDIAFEDKPIVVTKELTKGKTEEEIIRDKIPGFLRRVFPLDELSVPAERRRRNYDLPFAAIVDIDGEHLCDTSRWSKGMEEEYRKWFSWLKEQWGEHTVKEIEPQLCVPELRSLSERKRADALRTIRHIFRTEMELGLLTDDPWETYAVVDQQKKVDPQAAMNRNLSEVQLSENQIRQAIMRCFDGLRKKSYSGYYFATLLLLLAAVTLKQICALRYSDFSYLEFYAERMVVKIDKAVKNNGKNYCISELTRPEELRRIPLATLLQRAFETLKQTNADRIAGNLALPVVPLPKNHMRHSNPEQLQKWIKEEFEDIFDYAYTTQHTDMKRVLPHRVLANTARGLLRRCGYENEEFRYQIGLAPKQTYARSYCDFGAEAEFNRMTRLQDRLSHCWIPEENTEGSNTELQVLRKKGDMCRWSANGLGRCEVDIEIDFSKLAVEEGKTSLLLQLEALHGARYTIVYETKGDAGECQS